MPKLSQSTKSKNPNLPVSMHPAKNINLPKIDKIIARNNGSYKSPAGIYHQPNYHNERKQANIDVSNLLKIEGKNSNPKYKYDYE